MITNYVTSYGRRRPGFNSRPAQVLFAVFETMYLLFKCSMVVFRNMQFIVWILNTLKTSQNKGDKIRIQIKIHFHLFNDLNDYVT